MRRQLNKIIFRAGFVFAMALTFAVPAAAQTVWNGTANTAWYTSNPSASTYTITTAEQLAGLAQLVNGGNSFGGKTVRLGANIVLNSNSTNYQNWETTPPANSWTAIGNNYNRYFLGTFDGNGYVVNGVYINTTSNGQGLFGYLGSGGTIKNLGVIDSYIKGGSSVGGLVGENYTGIVSNSYSISIVIGSYEVGGLVGNNDYGTVRNSYSSGTVSGSDNIGSLVGYNGYNSNGTISNSYYDKTTSGRTDTRYGYGIGKTTVEMKSQAFADTLNFGAGVLSMNAWDYSVGKYPELTNTLVNFTFTSYFASGGGTETNPYIITTKEHLEYLSSFVNLGNNFNGKYFKLGNDIALNGTAINSWTAIGISYYNSFQGTFDGDGYFVSGVYINTTSDIQGLFGYLGSGGVIKNIGIIDSYIKGSWYVGGLVGYSYGIVNNSYSTSTVRGTGDVGGLVGGNSGTVNNSYSTGTVMGSEYVGGLIGYNDYNSTVSNSYYDKTTSGQTDTGKGEGKTTAEMQNPEFAYLLNVVATTLSMNAWVYSDGEYPVLSNELANVTPQTDWYDMADTTWYTKKKSESTYIITTAEQLAGLARLVNGASGNGIYRMSGKTIKLGNDIALNDTIGWKNWNETNRPANSWTAVGTAATSNRPFLGTFDGNGHVVSGVYIDTTSNYHGLFGYLGDGGIIKNVGIVASYVKDCCALVGQNSFGTVSNSYSNVGGLVGVNSGTVSNSYSVTITENIYYNITGKSEAKTTAEMQTQIFADVLNLGATNLSMNAWVYSEGKYPTLSNSPAETSEINIADYFASGEGTESNPYIITTKGQLANLSYFVNAGNNFIGEYFKLGNDIVLNDTANWQSWSETNRATNEWTAIGSQTNPFKGIFDGNDYVVSGVYINTKITSYLSFYSRKSFQGFFGQSNGIIKNLRVVNSHIAGGNYIGGLIGFNCGTVSNSYFTGTVTGGSDVGSLTGGSDVGGLVGSNHGTVSNSYFAGTVTGKTYVGGLVGYNYVSGIYPNYENIYENIRYDKGIISNSYSTGVVNGINYVGGLVGKNEGTVNNSYSTGAVSGSEYVGGLVGFNDYNDYKNEGTVNNSYSTGAVSGSEYVGGLIGFNDYNDYKNVVSSYYDIQTSGQTDTGKGEGKTTTEMQSQAFTDLLNAGSYVLSMNAWIYAAGKYPELTNTPPSGISSYFANGDGTEASPYIITTKEQLEKLSLFVNVGNELNEYFKLGNDIVLNDTTGWQNWETTPPANSWTAIGTRNYSFKGTFDGDGHVVSGVYINTTFNTQGLFGYLGDGGIIKNVGIVASYIKGGGTVGGLVGGNCGTINNSYFTGTVTGNSGSSVGGLVGSNCGTINNSYSTNAVIGSGDFVGGLVGHNNGGQISNSYSTSMVSGGSGLVGTNRGTISNSYATGAVTGSSYYVGGLVGINREGTISNSYATGTVTGSYYVGGLVGQNYDMGTVTNCYSTGTVTGNFRVRGLIGLDYGTVSNNYYDIQTSGKTDDFGGIGKTTAEMKRAVTYLGWDFETIWGRNNSINNGYPYLRTFVNGYIEDDEDFYEVTNISGIPATSTYGETIILNGTVYPENATNKNIIWSTINGNVTITENSITFNTFGSVEVKAVILNGVSDGVDFEKNFIIEVGKLNGTGIVSIDGWIYGDEPNVPISTNGTGAVSYAYKVQGASDATYSAKVPTNAGNYTIQATFAESDNYLSHISTTDFTITPKPITVTADNNTKIYSNADPALTYSVEPKLVIGDNFTGTLSRTTGNNVGTYTINQGTLSAGNNYNITFESADFTITPKPIIVTATPKTKIYGYADPTLTYNVNPALVTGNNFTGALSRTTGNNVGTYTINQGTLSAGNNYNITFESADFTITPRHITVTATPKTKVYGNVDPALIYSVSPALVSGDNLSGALSRTTGNNAGTYTINKGTLSASNNYELTFVSTNFTITPKPVTIKGISAVSKEYDGNTTATITGTATVIGTISGDNVTVTNGTASFANSSVGINKTVTFNSFSLSGTDADNYTLSTQPTKAAANIFPKSVTITGLSAASKEYDGNTTATITGTPTIDGTIDGDDVSVVNGTASFANSSIGTNKIVTFSGFYLVGADAENYALVSQPANTTADITPVPTIEKQTPNIANLIFTIPTNKIYNQNPQSIDEVTGADGMGVITVKYNGSETAPTNAGTYTITAYIAEGSAFTSAIIPLGNFTISKAIHNIDHISFNDSTVTHTGEEHNILHEGELPPGVIVTYHNNGKIEEGEHYVIAIFTNTDPNYHDIQITKFAKLTIESADNTPTIPNRANPSIGGIGVQTISGGIILTNVPSGAKVEVYNLNGKRIHSVRALHATPSLSIPVQTKGMYIIRINSQTLRVTIK